MSNVTNKTYRQSDDEEGVASGAAVLGIDGGPGSNANTSVAAVEESFDEVDEFEDLEDDSWLDEELTDEELAALSEEDFAEFDLDDVDDDGELDESDIDATFAEADAGDDLNASLDSDDVEGDEQSEDLVAVDLDDDPLVSSDDEDEIATPDVEEGGAVVAAQAIVPDIGDMGGEITDLGEEDVDHRPVPRISIHAFCETPAVTALLEKASVDRRLSKAHLTIHMGGLAKAINQFQSTSTPNLIILETMAGGAEIFAQLGELAEVCDPSTKVVIIGQVNDIILYRELIRQGVSEYIVRPQSPLQIIKTIADLYVDPAAPPIGRTLAFVGARGGVGSSTIAHNVSWCIAEEFQSDTILLDLDLPFGTASLDFDQDASAGLFEALSSPERLDDVLLERLLQKHTDHLSLFTAPSALDRDYDIDDQAYETVIDVVRSVAPTVAVDVPHVWCSWSKRLLTTADEIIITATPDLAAFRNTKQLIDLISSARPNDVPPKLIINQFDPKLSPVRPEQFAEHVGIEPTQVFVTEPQIFNAAATNAAPIVEVSPKSKSATSFLELAALLIGREEYNIAKPRFSLSGLFKK